MLNTGLFLLATALAFPAEAPAATCSLPTDGKQIRQFAFDGDPETYFASLGNAGEADRFTLDLAKPIAVRSIEAKTGRPGGGDELEGGSLEVSADGQAFESVARFDKLGVARFVAEGRQVRAIRIKPDPAKARPLVVREIMVDSAEPVPIFAYPVEYTVDVADAPEMKEWADKAAALCEAWYPKLNELLKSDGYKPPTQVSMALKSSYKGVAQASGNRITGSVAFFKAHPDDLGAMIHETIHVIQRYRGQGNPGWLVEGIADNIRFFVYEPGKAGPVNSQKAHYNNSYRTSATFLDYVARTYDPQLILQLNRLLREGKYKDDSFQDLTGKTLVELDEEWLKSLAK